jgi:Mg-chelatase subunit ChlD
MNRRFEPPNPARLLVETPAGTVKVALTSEVFSLGSDAGCSLAFDLPGVAPRHAVIQREGDAFELFDLVSPEGTFVNGRRVEAAVLKTGDAIRLGAVRMVFLFDAPSPAPTPLDPAPALDFLDEPASRSPSPDLDSAATAWNDRAESEATPKNPVSSVHSPESGVREPLAFDEIFVAQLKRTPFYLTSVLLHLGILTVLALMASPPQIPPVVSPVYATFDVIPSAPDRTLGDVEPPPAIEEPVKHEAEGAPAPEASPAGLLQPTPADGAADLAPLGATEAEARPFRGDASEGAAGRGAALEFAGGPFRGGSGSGGAALRAYADELRGAGLDVVFAIDATGSMDACLDDARSRINDAIAVLAALVPQFRLGLVAYRDVGDAWRVKSVPLTAHHYEAVDFLDAVRAEGGGDRPEAVDEGLRVAAGMKFGRKSRRILVLVGDAPPHDEAIESVRSLADELPRKRSVLHSVYCSATGGPDERVRALFSDLARRAGGVALDLSEGRRLIDEVLPVIFGESHRTGMKQAIEDVTLGRRAVRWREFVATVDAERIRRELEATSINTPYLLSALARNPRPEHLRAFLDLLADRRTPEGTRWAAAVFAKRVIRRATPPARLLELAEGLIPSLPTSVLEERLRLVRTGAARIGFEVAPFPVPPRSASRPAGAASRAGR